MTIYFSIFIFRAEIVLSEAANSPGGQERSRASCGGDLAAADWQFGEDLNMGLFWSPDRSCWESGSRPEALYLQ